MENQLRIKGSHTFSKADVIGDDDLHAKFFTKFNVILLIDSPDQNL